MQMMPRLIVPFLWLALLSVTVQAAENKPYFGPVKYDVKERYGKENRYTVSVPAAEGPAVLLLQNGEQVSERSDWLEVTLNGQVLIKDDRYDYRFLAAVVSLKKENAIEVLLKDNKPTGLRRPPAVPKFVFLSLHRAPAGLKALQGVLGASSWDGAVKLGELISASKAPAAGFALEAANLQNAVEARAAAMRKLADQKEPTAQAFLLWMLSDMTASPMVRGEAALALGMLGDKKTVPLLMQGLLDPEEQVSLGSARALSFYPEADTQDMLTKTLEQLDAIRKDALIRSIISAGWQPVGTVLKLAESTDRHIADLAVGLLGGIRDPRAADLLLKFLAEPGSRDPRGIITSLGRLKEPRAADPLLKLASDAKGRRGVEVELSAALAELGDQRAVPMVESMIKTVPTRTEADRIREAYKKLTGRDYK